MLTSNSTLERLDVRQTQMDEQALSTVGNALEQHYLRNPKRAKVLVECEYYSIRPSLGWTKDLHKMPPAAAKLFSAESYFN